MSDKLYRVSYSWYEEYNPTIVSGPKVDDWETYCKRLVPEACIRAAKNAVSGGGHEHWVGMNDIKDAVVEILIDKGYTVLKPVEFDIFGGCIVENRKEIEKYMVAVNEIEVSAIETILDHNERVRKRLDSRLIDRKK